MQIQKGGLSMKGAFVYQPPSIGLTNLVPVRTITI